jgi:hypothetical protein
MAPEPNTSKSVVEGAKKKRNRKKKTKTGPKEEEQVVVKESQNALNPAVLLRRQLIEKEGFDEGQIDKAMEEMWDQQLPYDEYESVLKYLKSGASALAQAQAQAAPSQAPRPKAAAIVKEVAPAPADPTPELESEEEEEDSGVEEPQPQISMASKLDMVAGFENFTDGAFALTEWVSKVAKPHEVRIILYYEIEGFLILGGVLSCIALREEATLSLLCWYPFFIFPVDSRLLVSSELHLSPFVDLAYIF